MIGRFSIKAILTSLIVLTIVVLIGLFSTSFYYSSEIHKANELYSNGLILKNFSYRVGRDEYRYREYGDGNSSQINTYSDIFRKNMLSLSEGVSKLESDFRSIGILHGMEDKFRDLYRSLKQYEEGFEQLVEKSEHVGNIESGLIQKMEHEKFRFLQKNSELKGFSFKSDFLELVSEELNFRLYRDMKHKIAFDELQDALFLKIKGNAKKTTNTQDALLQILSNYKGFFSELYDASSLLGLLSQTNGTIGEMRKELYNAQQEIDALIKRAKKHQSKMMKKSEREAKIINIVLSVFLASILILSLRRVEKSIRELEHSISNMKLGSKDLRQRVDLNRVIGLKSIAEDVNQMIDNIENYIKEQKVKILDRRSLLNSFGELSIKSKDESNLIHELIDKSDKKSREIKDSVEKIEKTLTREDRLFKSVKESFEQFGTLVEVVRDRLEESNNLTLDLSNKFIVVSDSVNGEMVEILSNMSEIIEELDALSITAAIEASRAGELGEEFSKIADSIKGVETRVESEISRIKSEREVSGNLLLNINKDLLNSSNALSSARANAIAIDKEGNDLVHRMAELFIAIAVINERSREANRDIVELVDILDKLSLLSFNHTKSSLDIVNEVMALSDQNSENLTELEKFNTRDR